MYQVNVVTKAVKSVAYTGGSAGGLAIDSERKDVDHGGRGVLSGLRRVAIDGTRTDLVVAGVEPVRVAIDSVGEKVYWTEAVPSSTHTRIKRANLDGTNVESVTLITAPITDLLIDRAANRLYASDNNSINDLRLDDGQYVGSFPDS